MLKASRLAMLTMMLLELGCKSVQPSELLGSWLMTDSSRQAVPSQLQKASARIALYPNGTFVASDMPALFFFPGHCEARLESGTGVWKVVSIEGQQQVQLNFQTIADWNKTDLPYGTQLNISTGWSKVSLYYFIGDPDEGRMIEFERK